MPANPIRPTPPVTGARFDHVALAAPRLRDMLPLYVDVLGGRPVESGDSERFGFRWVEVELSEAVHLELMEPLPGSDFFKTFFERRGGGPHHVTFTVDDLGVAIKQLERDGRWELFGEDRTTSDWQHVFIRPSTNGGALVQIAQSDLPPRHTLATLHVEDILEGQHGIGTPSP